MTFLLYDELVSKVAFSDILCQSLDAHVLIVVTIFVLVATCGCFTCV